MSSRVELKQVLLKLAGLLNAGGVTWALGGSLLLQRHGLVTQARDIDLLVADEALPLVHEIFDQYALLIEKNSEGAEITSIAPGTCRSEHFRTYLWEGVAIDVIAGFRIYTEEGVFALDLNGEMPLEEDLVEGVSLPYMVLEDWLFAYGLMVGRGEKFEAILHYLMDRGSRYPGRLREGLNQPLPRQLRERISSLFE